jgi:hypothetical protein
MFAADQHRLAFTMTTEAQHWRYRSRALRAAPELSKDSLHYGLLKQTPPIRNGTPNRMRSDQQGRRREQECGDQSAGDSYWRMECSRDPALVAQGTCCLDAPFN